MIREERGFALMELMFATVILSLGIMALLSTFDGSRRLSTTAEKRDTASAAAEKEIERITASPWSKVALAAAPSQGSGATDPSAYVSTGPCGGPKLPASSPCYQWDWTNALNVEPLVIDTVAGDTTPNPQVWTTPSPSGGTRFSGKTYHYVTWVNDPSCLAATCGGTGGDRRVTVAVTVAGLHEPVIESTILQNPAGGSAKNPIAAGATCLDGGASVPCSH